MFYLFKLKSFRITQSYKGYTEIPMYLLSSSPNIYLTETQYNQNQEVKIWYMIIIV
jgi:hypothetical protein